MQLLEFRASMPQTSKCSLYSEMDENVEFMTLFGNGKFLDGYEI